MTTPISPSAPYFANLTGNVSTSVIDTRLDLIIANQNAINQYTAYGVDSGAADAYVVTAAAIGGGAGLTAALTAGISVWWKPTNTSTLTNPTLNVAATGAKVIISQDGSALTAGQLVSGRLYFCIYDGTNWVLANTAATSGIVNASVTSYYTFSGTTSVAVVNGIAISRIGNNVSMSTTSAVNVIANSTTNGLTIEFTDNAGVPLSIASTYRPAKVKMVPCVLFNASVLRPAYGQVRTNGSGIDFQLLQTDFLTILQFGNFDIGGSKGFPLGWNITYPIGA